MSYFAKAPLSSTFAIARYVFSTANSERRDAAAIQNTYQAALQGPCPLPSSPKTIFLGKGSGNNNAEKTLIHSILQVPG